jgi:hypothetical protein
VGLGLGAGVGVGRGVGVGFGVGVGLGLGVGLGVGVAFGLGVAVGLGVGVAIGLGVGDATGLGVGEATTAVGLGRGEAIGSRLGVGMGSKSGVAIGSNVKGSDVSGGGVALDLGGGAGVVASGAGDRFLFWKGAEAASCARTSVAAARNRVAKASRRMIFFELFPWSTESDASPRSSARSSRIDFARGEPSAQLERVDPPDFSILQFSWTKHALATKSPASCHASPSFFSH